MKAANVPRTPLLVSARGPSVTANYYGSDGHGHG